MAIELNVLNSVRIIDISPFNIYYSKIACLNVWIDNTLLLEMDGQIKVLNDFVQSNSIEYDLRVATRMRRSRAGMSERQMSICSVPLVSVCDVSDIILRIWFNFQLFVHRNK